MQESEARDVLAAYIARTYRTKSSHRVVHELALPQRGARVDLAVIADSLDGFEIKTANDTLGRLPQQQAAYGLVFDRMIIVAERKHLPKALEVVPAWWGVLELITDHRGSRLIQRRRSRLNPDVRLRALVELLWRDEVLAELVDLGLDHGARSANRAALWERLAGAVPQVVSRKDLRARVRARLTSREGWRAA